MTLGLILAVNATFFFANSYERDQHGEVTVNVDAVLLCAANVWGVMVLVGFV